MLDEWWMQEAVEVFYNSTIWCTILELACKGWGKLRKTWNGSHSLNWYLNSVALHLWSRNSGPWLWCWFNNTVGHKFVLLCWNSSDALTENTYGKETDTCSIIVSILSVVQTFLQLIKCGEREIHVMVLWVMTQYNFVDGYQLSHFDFLLSSWWREQVFL
jgi:hypothetical protein